MRVYSPWVLNQNKDILVNLETGERIAIIPSQKQEGVTLYGLFVQTPIRETLLSAKLRPELAGYNNTALLDGAPLDDCQNLLEILRRQREGYEVTDCPILPPDDEEDACYVLRIKGRTSPCYVGDDEETVHELLLDYVKNHWRRIFGGETPIPENRTEAIDLYFDEGATEESYEIIVSPFIRRKDLRRG